MCGRFSLVLQTKEIEERFKARFLKDNFKPRFNCAPSQFLPIVSTEDISNINFYKWGLIPFWAKDQSIGNKLINSKSETILEKPSFRNSFKHKRCLILADGFYEWMQIGKTKKPYRIEVKNGEPFAMAGIWDEWKNTEGETIKSFSIITTKANELVGEIHDRMPVILPVENEKNWLINSDINFLESLLKPFPSEKMNKFVISNAINNPKNDFPELIIPIK